MVGPGSGCRDGEHGWIKCIFDNRVDRIADKTRHNVKEESRLTHSFWLEQLEE